MTTRSKVLATTLLTLALLPGCGGKGKGGGSSKSWMSKKWVPVSGQLEGMAFSAEIPEGLPQNKEAIGSQDWMGEIGKAGPRMTLSYPRTREFADAEAFARHLQPLGPALIEVSKDKTADGRLRVVSALNGGSHQDVSVWIPLPEGRGVECTAHWYRGAGSGDGENKPDTELLAWLGRFCDSVKLTP